MNDDVKQLAERFKLIEKKVITAEPQVLTLRYSPDGKRLVAAGYDGRVRRWDATNEELPELAALAGHNGWAQAIAFSPDSATIFTGDSYGELRAWPLAENEPQPKWRVEQAHDGWLRDAAMNKDGTQLATCGADRVVRLWNPADGAKVTEIRGEQDDLYVVCYSADGAHLLAGDRRGMVWQWEVATQKLVRKFDASVLYKLDRIQDVGGVRALAFSRDGAQLAVGGMKPKNGATIQGVPALLVFDFGSGELKHTFDLGGQNDCDLMGVHLHDEGFFIAVTNGGPGAGKIVMQRLGDKEPFFSEGKIANVQSLTLSPDGKRMAVSGTNGGSNGNGRNLDKDGQYPANRSPIHVFGFGPA
jgi:WD40 repeat protein